PVYRLLGAKDLGATEVPELDKPVTSGSLAFHYHSGGHMAGPADWRAFLDFAERHFKAATREFDLPGMNRMRLAVIFGCALVGAAVLAGGFGAGQPPARGPVPNPDSQ